MTCLQSCCATFPACSHALSGTWVDCLRTYWSSIICSSHRRLGIANTVIKLLQQQHPHISHVSCNAALHCPTEQVFGEGLSTVLADARAVLSEASLATTDFADTALAEFAGSSVQRGAAKTSAGLVEPSQCGNA